MFPGRPLVELLQAANGVPKPERLRGRTNIPNSVAAYADTSQMESRPGSVERDSPAQVSDRLLLNQLGVPRSLP